MFIKKILNIVPKGEDSRMLISNFGYLTILQIAGYLFPIITVPYLARVIGAEGIGRIAFASAVMVWFQTIADWGFNLTATRDVAKCRANKEAVSRIFSETFWARCLLMVVSFVLLCLLILLIPTFRDSSEILLVTFLMIPGHIMFPDWFFQALERMKFTTITNIVVKFVFTVAVFVFIKEKEDYIYQPLLTSIGYVIAGLISMYIILKRWGYRLHLVSLTQIFSAIKKSTDVFINAIFPNLYNSLSVVLLGVLGGPVANGLYSEGNKFATICQNFLGVLSRVFFPLLSRRIEKFNIYLYLYLGATLLAAIILFVGAPVIIGLFYTEEFLQSIPVLRIMAVSLIFLAMGNAFGTNYLIVQGHEHILRKITVWCSLAGFVVAYPLISKYTYIGVALTVTFSRMCLGVSSMIAVINIKKRIGGGKHLIVNIIQDWVTRSSYFAPNCEIIRVFA